MFDPPGSTLPPELRGVSAAVSRPFSVIRLPHVPLLQRRRSSTAAEVSVPRRTARGVYPLEMQSRPGAGMLRSMLWDFRGPAWGRTIYVSRR